jgi:hypothetical protein
VSPAKAAAAGGAGASDSEEDDSGSGCIICMVRQRHCCRSSLHRPTKNPCRVFLSACAGEASTPTPAVDAGVHQHKLYLNQRHNHFGCQVLS